MISFVDLGLATGELRGLIEAAVIRILDGGRYVGGEEVEAFEREFAAYCGAAHAVGTGNGLDALTLMLKAFEVGPGDEVIVPSHTFIATWLAVSGSGAHPVPVEPKIATCNLDPQRVEEAIKPHTRAVLVAHMYGQSAEMNALRDICDRRGILLLADAAQAHGLALGQAHAAAFSFYPIKNLGALGDGGAVVTRDPEIARRVRLLGNYGSHEKYVHEIRGANSRLDPLQAAILRVKLGVLDQWNGRRRAIAQHYQEGLAGTNGLALPYVASGCEMVWHLFAVRHPERDRLARALKAAGIETLIHYPQPPHLSGAYRDAGFCRGDFPLAEQIADTELSLPLHPHLTIEHVQAVINATRKALGMAASGGRG